MPTYNGIEITEEFYEFFAPYFVNLISHIYDPREQDNVNLNYTLSSYLSVIALPCPSFQISGTARDRLMPLDYVFGPTALDECEHRPNLLVGDFTRVSRHVALIARTGQSRRPLLGHGEQEFVGMMPGMAGLIMGRRRQAAIGPPLPPVGLTLQLVPMTARALGAIDNPAQGDLGGILGIGAQGRMVQLHDQGGADHQGNR